MADPFGIDDPRGDTVPTRQEGNLFVPEGATLPPFRVNCAKPAREYSKQTFVALPRFDQVWLLFLGHVPYRRTSLGVPLCSEHLSRRWKLAAVSVLACLMILPAIVWTGFRFDLTSGLFAGFVAFVIALVP